MRELLDAQLIGADLLVLLTDTQGLLSADPRLDPNATLIEEIVEFDKEIEAAAGGPGTAGGSGGMASKLAAAKIAAWSGIRTVIASASRPNVLREAVAGVAGVGTIVAPHDRQIPARKLWIAFAVRSSGTLIVDDGARRALERGGVSLLAAGLISSSGDFLADDAVEIADQSGEVFGKGLVRVGCDDLPHASSVVVVHADDLVILG